MKKIKRRIRRKEVKRRNKKIIFSCLLIVCLLAVGYGAFQTTISINTTGRIVVDERCVVGNTFNFEQKDEIQEFIVPCSGTYKLETWGAQGGDANDHDGNDKTIGGYGGYSTGNFLLKLKDKLYIGVGGKGETAYNSVVEGGYNGGGKSSTASSSSYGDEAGSGGGATHIAINNNLEELKNYNSNKDSIILVAAGGGGAYYYETSSIFVSNGGHAGGYNGCIPKNYICQGNPAREYYIGILSNQERGGGNFGCANYESQVNGGNSGFGFGATRSGGSWSSGGGSGYYGGGYGFATGAGGGSSYIGNSSLTDKAMYCYDCEESLDLNHPEIFTISTTGDTNYKDTLNCPNGYDENPVSKCAKKGDGYARITLISKK